MKNYFIIGQCYENLGNLIDTEIYYYKVFLFLKNYEVTLISNLSFNKSIINESTSTHFYSMDKLSQKEYIVIEVFLFFMYVKMRNIKDYS